jgi:large subunit ribosomal protein L2
MNPVSHPMGGGEGRSKGGNVPQSPTGVPSKGGKTRHPRKPSSRFIIHGRKKRIENV